MSRMHPEGCVRLDVLLRRWGIAGKQEIRELAAQGRITVGGQVVTDAAWDCVPDSVITLDGRVLQPKEPLTLMMNKPAGTVCVSGVSPYLSVFSLLSGDAADCALFAIGRLDADTEGLLLLSNDGALCDRIARPEQALEKTYQVTFDRPLIPDASERLKTGILLPNGTQCRPARLMLTGTQSALITVTEGKYHEVKRLIRACGARVASLRRISIGGLTLDPGLPLGGYRPLRPEEIVSIFEKQFSHAE